MTLKMKKRWINEDGFEFTFEPEEDSLTIEKTSDGYVARYLSLDSDPLPPDSLESDDNIFLVHYHDHYLLLERDEIIKRRDVQNWYRQEFTDYDDYDLDDDGEEVIIPATSIPQEKDYWLFAVAAYIHGGISLSLKTSFPCDPRGWDTSHVGMVLVARSEWPDEEKAILAAKGLLESWNMYLGGDVWLAVQEVFNDEKESCAYDVIGGFYGYDESLEVLRNGDIF